MIECMMSLLRISIHAPAKGATQIVQMKSNMRKNFNPRSREGSDQLRTQRNGGAYDNFNPRSREGSDMLGFYFTVHFLYFNPRSREGSDFTFV